jgi:spore maturation protein CgeB
MTTQFDGERCPVCESRHSRSFGVVDDYPMSRCSTCGHLYVSCAVSDSVLAGAYGKNYYGGSADQKQARSGYDDYLRDMAKRVRGFNQRLAELEHLVAPPGRALDFGCAVGLFVRAAQDRGWTAVGYDRSEWAAAYGREKLGVNIQSGGAPQFDEGSFDLITLWDCIEHLPDPRGTLLKARGWLRAGGVLAVNTVNSSSLGARLAGKSWRHIMPPLHLNLFSSRSLRRLVTDTGFSIIRTHGEGVVFTASNSPAGSTRVRRALDDVACHWRLRPITSRLNLRDELLVVARRSH